MTLLRVSQLRAGYGRGDVLQGIDLAVEPNTTVSIIGPNGAGKTTLLRAISGTLRPTGGSIEFDGASILRRSATDIVTRGISQVPQGRHLFGGLTVRENLLLGGHSVRRTTDLEKRIEELTAAFPVVGERLDALAHTLSGGQQQMVAIARGLMPEPKLLLLDEPSVGLAPTIIDDVAALIARLKEAGRTVLLSEQNVPLALSLADRVYVIAQGKVVASGTPAEISAMDDVRRAYLGLAAGGAA